MDLEIGAVNEEGLRGTKATREMVKGQIAVKLPRALAVPLAEWDKTSEVRCTAS